MIIQRLFSRKISAGQIDDMIEGLNKIPEKDKVIEIARGKWKSITGRKTVGTKSGTIALREGLAELSKDPTVTIKTKSHEEKNVKKLLDEAKRNARKARAEQDIEQVFQKDGLLQKINRKAREDWPRANASSKRLDRDFPQYLNKKNRKVNKDAREIYDHAAKGKNKELVKMPVGRQKLKKYIESENEMISQLKKRNRPTILREENVKHAKGRLAEMIESNEY